MALLHIVQPGGEPGIDGVSCPYGEGTPVDVFVSLLESLLAGFLIKLCLSHKAQHDKMFSSYHARWIKDQQQRVKLKQERPEHRLGDPFACNFM